MPSQVEMIAANQQRQLIPNDWVLVFNDWTNPALLSLSEDIRAPVKVRAWAGWELEYRIAFEIEPPLSPELVTRDVAPKVGGSFLQVKKILEERR